MQFAKCINMHFTAIIQIKSVVRIFLDFRYVMHFWEESQVNAIF